MSLATWEAEFVSEYEPADVAEILKATECLFIGLKPANLSKHKLTSDSMGRLVEHERGHSCSYQLVLPLCLHFGVDCEKCVLSFADCRKAFAEWKASKHPTAMLRLIRAARKKDK